MLLPMDTVIHLQLLQRIDNKSGSWWTSFHFPFRVDYYLVVCSSPSNQVLLLRNTRAIISSCMYESWSWHLRRAISQIPMPNMIRSSAAGLGVLIPVITLRELIGLSWHRDCWSTWSCSCRIGGDYRFNDEILTTTKRFNSFFKEFIRRSSD
jgi:hypothetical protein